MIQTNHLEKYFNKHKENEIHVIKDATITFEDTGLVCLLGESGSGKTTFLNTIGGLDSFQSGTITVGDVTLKKYNYKMCDKFRNELYGYIFQNYYLLPDATIWYNIELVLNIYDIPEKEKTERIEYVLKAVGMYKYRKKLVRDLSGGQMQRVAIARALVKSPKIIFADEPTGNLDKKNTIQIMNIIKKISKECLVLLVTHEKDIAYFYADRILHINDGKIIKDETNKKSETLDYIDDETLYLKDYDKKGVDCNFANINVYNHKDCNAPTIQLNIIYEHGQYFIQASSTAPVATIDNNGQIEVLDSHRPVISQNEIEEFNYHLPNLKSSKKSKLSKKELWHIAWDNIVLMKKKQIFLFLSLIIMAVLLTISVNDFMTVSSVHPETVVLTDARSITIEYTTNDYVTNYGFQQGFNGLYDKLKQEKIGETLPVHSTSLEYSYNEFIQLGVSKLTIEGFSFMPLSYLDSSKLIYGRLPNAFNEVVLDKWVCDKALKSNSIAKNLFSNAEDFIGKTLDIKEKNLSVVVVGISDANNMSIYGSNYLCDSLPTYSTSANIYSEYEEKYKNIDTRYYSNELETIVKDLPLTKTDTQVDIIGSKKLWDSVRYKGFKLNLFNSELEFNVIGYYTNDFYNVDILFPEGLYSTYNDLLIKYNKKFQILSTNQSQIDSYFSDTDVTIPTKDMLGNDVNVSLRQSKSNLYQEKMESYLNELIQKRNSRLIVTLTVLLATVFILYFTMKSSAIKKIYDIGVYRSIGIGKNSLIELFAIQILSITLFTTIPTVLITVGVYFFLATIPSIGISVYLSLLPVLGILVGLTLLNVFIGILPIINLLRLPPAVLTSKYDM